MRKVLMMVGVAVVTAALATPVFAVEPTGGGLLDSSTMIAARGRHRRRAVKPKGPGLEESIRRIVEEAMKKGGEWNYMAKRMRPPKGKKWQGRWNELGAQGWDLVGQNENVYIFKRPARYAGGAPAPAPKMKDAPVKEPKAIKGGGRYAPPAESAPSPGRKPTGRDWR